MARSETLDIALAERDEILRTMDVERAQQYIAKHGGTVTKQDIDWIKVLHLARLEVTSIPEAMRQESRLWLAQNGARSLKDYGMTSPYGRMTIDLIFPATLTNAYIEQMGGKP